MNTASLSNQETPGRWMAIFYVGFTVLAFSSIEIIINPVRNEIAPLLMNFWRFLVGITVLFPFLLISKRREIAMLSRRDMFIMGCLGCLNILFAMGSHSICIKYATASTAAILISANPLATNFFSWLILKEPMSFARVLSLVLGLAGIMLITLKANVVGDTALGVAAGVVSMTGFGLYTVLSKKMVNRHGSLLVLVFSCWPALILYLPILYFTGSGFIPPDHVWPNVLGAGIFGTGLGYLTFMKALEFMPAGRASYLFFMKPPVAIFLAWLFLGETIKAKAVLGMILIMTGILAEARRAGRKSASS